MIPVLRTIDQLRSLRSEFALTARSVGFVPTMGALHAGHLSLISACAMGNDEVVVSIFVNPLQFGSPEDLVHYPRQLEADVQLAANAGATLIFAPDEEQMFPRGVPIVTVDPGALGVLLEGRARPGHMRGVATIVTKLLSVVGADRAYFGEKDFEQLTLVRHLALDLDLGVEIVGMPIVREDDGLAMSSRNQRLSADDRQHALVLFRALQRGREEVERGESDLQKIERIMGTVIDDEPGVTLDYAAVRSAVDLSAPTEPNEPLRLLVAATVGPVRLIDNLAIKR